MNPRAPHAALTLVLSGAEPKVEPMMQFPVRVVFALRANRALAPMNVLFRHRFPPSLEDAEVLYRILRRLTGHCRRPAMRKALALVAMFFSFVVSPTFGDDQVTLQSLLNEMVNRDALAELPDISYTTGQASSYDRHSVAPDQPGWFANNDYFNINNPNYVGTDVNAQGQTEYILMDVSGPGAITRFWKGGNDPNAILSIYLDGSSTPAIQENAQAFLGGSSWMSAPMAATTGKGLNLAAPIPFANGCKVTLSNCDLVNDPEFFNIEYRKYSPQTTVQSFTKADYQAQSSLVSSVGTKLNNAQAALSGVTSWLPSTQQQLAPNQSLQTSVSSSGSGAAIRSLTVNIQAGDMVSALRNTMLNITFDGQKTVSCPVGDFFGSGQGLNPYQDWANQVTKNSANDGTLTCYWTMPFDKNCTIQLVNQGTQAVTATLGQVGVGNWQWDNRSMYFHSNWHSQTNIQTKAADGTMDWNYITIQGQGVYVGDSLTVRNGANSWWGEGDEKIYVDGEKFPSHFGTGTEDFYGYSNGDPEVFQSPFHAQPLCGANESVGYTTDTRIRALDGISFSNSLSVNLEIWNWAATTVDYGAATYWYGLPGATCNLLTVPEPGTLALLATGLIGLLWAYVWRKLGHRSRSHRVPGDCLQAS